jgi:hypothetical protein
MRLVELAHNHCANWRKDGKGCLGAIIDDDLQIRWCMPRPVCLLTTPRQRCQYFEECVMPMVRSIEDPAYRQEFEEAVRLYKVAVGLPYADERGCPGCGRPMEPGKRFCHLCAKARHRANQREWIAKRRAGKQVVGATQVES